MFCTSTKRSAACLKQGLDTHVNGRITRQEETGVGGACGTMGLPGASCLMSVNFFLLLIGFYRNQCRTF